MDSGPDTATVGIMAEDGAVTVSTVAATRGQLVQLPLVAVQIAARKL
jgi:hypothetical protein